MSHQTARKYVEAMDHGALQSYMNELCGAQRWGLQTDKPRHGCKRFATANVCTLSPSELNLAIFEGRNFDGASRISLLERQFNDASFDVIGIQESRVRHNLTMTGDHYMMYCSSATPEGRGGVQLWIRCSMSKGVLEVTPVSSRLMLAAIKAGDAGYICVVGHAPIDDASPADRHDFWHSITTHAHSFYTKYYTHFHNHVRCQCESPQ